MKGFLLALILVTLLNSSNGQAPVDPSSIIGKVVCGYQGWFTCTGDGSPINQWTHWAPGNAPQPGIAPNPNPNLTFDVYPDISIYDPSSLFQTNFANHGDGTPAKLFSDYHQDVTDKHFALMQANGIDGVAFQRFIWEVLVDPRFKANRDTDAVHVTKAAEKYQRMFYVVYDLSGLGNVPAADDQARFDAVEADWTNDMIGNQAITSSPMYAKQGGKPVVQIWGIGYSHIIGTAAQQLALINWFKAQGCYVIIGVPIDWHKLGNTGSPGGVPAKANWTTAYLGGDMVSPWAVGAYSDVASADSYKTNYLGPDLTYCNTNGIAYQPVIFPGFSWSNWNGGTQNQIPRNKGLLLWEQAYNLRQLNIKTAEIAMMDEYDEGTAILPIADGYNEIPTNQYFVTSSADGTYLSPDFYLRLATKVTRQINQLDASSSTFSVPYSLSPLYFRTSNEVKYDPIAAVSSINTKTGVLSQTCTNSTTLPRRGLYSLKVTGTDNSSGTSYAYFNAFAVNIPVTLTTDLRFWTNPANALGRYISVDLVMTDGTTLRSTGATDMTGVSMHPATGRGTVGTWTETRCNIGQWLNGKTISEILVAYDHGPATGTFTGYIDDISVAEETYSLLPVKLVSFSAHAVQNDVSLQWQTGDESNLKQYDIERSIDGINFNKIGALPATKETGIKNHSFSDINVLLNFNNTSRFYYRLKMSDADGKTAYSTIQIVSIKRNADFIIKLFPNPFIDKIEVTTNAVKDDYINAVITGITGKTFINTKLKVTKGASKTTIKNLEELPKGIYFLKLSLEDESQTYKIEK